MALIQDKRPPTPTPTHLLKSKKAVGFMAQLSAK